MNIANFITFLRIIFTLIILFIKPLSALFYVCYTLAGLSDLLDGIVARRFNCQTVFGANLDSIADIFFGVVTFLKLYPFVFVNRFIELAFAFTLIIRVISLFVVYYKFNTFAILHTVSNKVTGLSIFLTVFFIKDVYSNFIGLIICALAIMSANEELFIHIASDKLDIDIKSIFHLVN